MEEVATNNTLGKKFANLTNNLFQLNFEQKIARRNTLLHASKAQKT